jgi:hypothetical protein
MTQSLELKFLNAQEKVVTITVDNPKLPVNPVLVNQIMDQIVSNNVFLSSGGPIVAKKSARLVGRETTEITLG